jgi:predicted MFS family arabinose efflux permease
MAVTDISTPLNRASSFAPISAGFAAGTAMGPALGGVLIDEIGTNPTFALVGGSFLMLGGINSFLLDETMKKPHRGFPWQHEALKQKKAVAALALSPDPSGSKHKNSSTEQHSNSSNESDDPDGSIQQAFKSALGQWAPLLSEAPVRNVCIINGFYWVALAGGQMTLLPLMLTDPSGLAMTATQVGQVYMGMSCVQVLGNPLFARVVDRVGTVPGIVSGCSMISASMWFLPACTTDYYSMAGVLGLWAAGSSLLSTSPIAHIGNTVDDSKRAQAIALLRTAGDVGFLVGASSVGMVSDWAGSMEQTMQSSAAILGTATTWYVARNLLTLKLREEDPK